jgi:Plasmid pRiA4b ORF-3-like protein
MAKSRQPLKKAIRTARRRVRLYSLKVTLSNGPGPVEKPLAWRTLQVRGDQTLAELHQGIAAAFGRGADASYEFELDAGPLHPEGKRYVLPGEYDVSLEGGTPAAGRVTETKLDGLGLKPGETFAYSPDGGDDWWHPITVERVVVGTPRGKYPKVTRREGESPFRPGSAGPARQPAPLGVGTEEGADTACLVGEVHLERGEYHKAVEAFSRALTGRPTADAYEGRARAYRALAAADERFARELRQT